MSKSIHALIVEDNRADLVLIQKTLAEQLKGVIFHTAGDGDEALQYLRRRDITDLAPRPDLVILDLSLPKRDGYEVLADIKSDAALRDIPVIVFTSSESRSDILKCYLSGANCYLTKASGLDEFVKVVRGIGDFWMSLVKLPLRANHAQT